MTKRDLKLVVSFVFLLITYHLPLTTTHADTIRTTKGEELKGIVVEDYKDRIVFSTVSGETVVPKSRIKELYLDSKEDNLLRLAERARERGEYGKSYDYYSMAMKINPASRQARDGMTFLHGYIFRQEELRKEEAVKTQEAIDKFGARIEPEKSEREAEREAEEGIKKRLGITLAMSGGFPAVENIAKEMGAYQAGMRKGDLIISVWGKLTGYMKLGEVAAALSQKTALEIKCVIERTVDVRIANRGVFSGPINMIGVSLSMEFDGLTVADVARLGPSDKAGIEKGDLVAAIDGRSTRYMPLKKAVDLIKRSKSDVIRLTIRKEVVLWRSGG